MNNNRSKQMFPNCYDVRTKPERLSHQYERIALVSQERHLQRLRLSDGKTLGVFSNWLLWQQAMERGDHAIFIEWGLVQRNYDDDLHKTLMIKASDWVYLEGNDASIFKGVSLGKQVSSEVILFIAAMIRLERALRSIIESFKPQELVYFDLRPYSNNLGQEDRLALARDLAAEFQLKLINKEDVVDADDDRQPMEMESAQTYRAPLNQSGELKQKLRSLLLSGVQGISRLSNFVRYSKHNVLLLLNTSLVGQLVHNYTCSQVRPVLLAGSQPKTLAFIFECFRKGVLLAHVEGRNLNPEEEERIRGIIKAYSEAWKTPSSDIMTQRVRGFVAKYVLTMTRLSSLASEVNKAALIVHQYKPKRIVVDGIKNPPFRMYIEIAKNSGVEVDYIWHSPMVPERFVYEAMGGDPRSKNLVSRMFSWGPLNERWLEKVGAPVAWVRTGSPIAERYRAASGEKKNKHVGPTLLLEYTVIISDLQALSADKYRYFVEAVRMLHKKGISEIVFKTHPGRISAKYYEDVARYFGIKCKVVKHQPLHRMLKEVGAKVIGSVHSGSMMESLAAGKDYIAMLLSPTSLDSSYYEDWEIVNDLNQLETAWDENKVVSSQIALEALYSFFSIPNASGRIWEVLQSDSQTDSPTSSHVQ